VLDAVLGLLLALGQVPADLPEGFASGATLRNSGVRRQQRLLILFRAGDLHSSSEPVPVTMRGAACRRIHDASLTGPIAYVRGRRLPVILEIEGQGAGALWVSLCGARGPSPT
jgi:hypothetical protein